MGLAGRGVLRAGAVAAQPSELTPLLEEKKVRGQGDQPGASRALEDEALVRSFKLALRRLIQDPTKISSAPKEKKNQH